MKKAKFFIIFAMLSLVVNAQDEVGYDKLNVKMNVKTGIGAAMTSVSNVGYIHLSPLLQNYLSPKLLIGKPM